MANEYSSELNNLGVRVSNLEDRVGNVKVTGDVRMRYQGYSKKGNLAGARNDDAAAIGNKRSLFDFRGRIQFNANVNKNTQAVVRLSSGNQEFGNTTSQEGTSKNAYIDQVYLAHEFGSHVIGLVGRFSTNVGAGLVHSGNVDGVAAVIGNDHVALKTAYGYLTSGTITNGRGTGVDLANVKQSINPSLTLLQLDTNLLNKKLQLGSFYAHINKGKEILTKFYNVSLLDGEEDIHCGLKAGDKFKAIYGYNAKVNLNRWTLSGEFTRNNLSNSNAWVAGVGYGNYDITEPGTYNLLMPYFNEDKNAFVADTLWNQPWNSNYKGWEATVDYALMKNVGLTAAYAFNSKYTDKQVAGTNTNDRGDYFLAKVNVLF